MGENEKSKGFTIEYTNKDIFDKINSMENKMTEMCGEYQRMREELAKYNGLRGRVREVEGRIDKIEHEGSGKNLVGDSVIKWGGWAIAVLTLYRAWIGS